MPCQQRTRATPTWPGRRLKLHLKQMMQQDGEARLQLAAVANGHVREKLNEIGTVQTVQVPVRERRDLGRDPLMLVLLVKLAIGRRLRRVG